MIKPLLLVLTAIALAPAHAAEPTVQIFKARGSIQCEPGSGTAPETMRKVLEKAKIPVQSVSCGVDGLMHVAMCGAEDAGILIFHIAAHHTQAAAALGFKTLRELPNAQTIPCQP